MKRIYFEIHQIIQGDYILVNFREKAQIYIITQGSIRLSKVFNNKEILTLAILVQDDLINMFHTIERHHYLAEALSSTLILSCNYRQILQQPNHYSSIYYELLLSYRRYIQKTNDMLQVLSHRDKKSRLTNLLLMLSKQFGIVTQFGIIINLNITHNTLATIIGSNRITITKVLNSLQRSKLVSVYHGKLLIHDPISLSLYHRNLHLYFS